MIILVVGLATGMLFSMKTLTKVSGSAGKNPKIESVVEDFLKAMGGDSNPASKDGEDTIGTYDDVVHVLTAHAAVGRRPSWSTSGSWMRSSVTTLTSPRS